MASDQTLSTGDIRTHSILQKREVQRKQKWARGEAWGPGRVATAHPRPAKTAPKYKRSNKELGVTAAKLSQRREIRDTDNYTSSDSSAEEDINEPSAAPEVDADITYSFDAAHGPSHGSQILSVAIAKAEERYENTVTDKLVQTEYELLDNTGDVIPAKPARKTAHRDAMIEEEFVLV